MRNKVQGMLVGLAIGDALGMPVECWGRERILKQYPQGITKYEIPDGHKWFQDEPAGLVTDDTQLSIAVMRGLMRGNSFNLDTIAQCQVEAMNESTLGWGTTTREAIRALKNGVHWSESGKTSESNRGLGNGVPMKVAPLAAFFWSHLDNILMCWRKLIDFSAMTHYTKLSAYAGVIHTHVLYECLGMSQYSYDPEHLFGVFNEAFECENCVTHLEDTPDDFKKRMESLRLVYENPEQWSFSDIAKEYNGSCYVYDSLPYTYAHWIKNHKSVQVLYDCINHGGDKNDTDSNASMLGAMLGAVHGIEIFEQEPHLLTGLLCYESLLEETNRFCDQFGI